MSEHTKGPWFVTEDYDIRQVEGDRRLYIASLIDIPYFEGGGEAVVRNGHLIAAAPEMLATLKNMRRTLKSMRSTLLKLGGDPIPILDEVIAKAEGTHA